MRSEERERERDSRGVHRPVPSFSPSWEVGRGQCSGKEKPGRKGKDQSRADRVEKAS